ncbi:MAG: sugar ABC transporter substrate-binding protein [Erysipelotrichaceae bacterium]|jgi:ABC-type sugar transport system substrate-binding protein
MKKILKIITIFLVLFSLVACSETNEEKAKIGIVVPDLNNSFCSAMYNGVKRAGEEKGYEVFEYVTEMNPENDVNSVELLANNGVLAYYGLHMAGDSVGSILKDKYPQIGCFSQTAFEGATQHIVDSFDIVADHFVESLGEFMEENNLTEVEICGIWLSNAQIEGTTENEQYTTFMNRIQSEYANTGIKYIQSEYPSDAEDVANTVETLLLSTNATIFFCCNNDFAISASNIISSAKSDTSSYFVFSTEGDSESFRLIADVNSPYRAASVADTEETGYQVGLQLVNWIENGKMEGISVARELVDWRNVADKQ